MSSAEDKDEITRGVRNPRVIDLIFSQPDAVVILKMLLADVIAPGIQKMLEQTRPYRRDAYARHFSVGCAMCQGCQFHIVIVGGKVTWVGAISERLVVFGHLIIGRVGWLTTC